MLIEDQGKTNSQVRAYVQQVCSCQEKILLKIGFSQAQFLTYGKEGADFMSGKRMRREDIVVTPKINAVINSDSVKKRCGSIFE
ncbi:MAG: hypothetical protein ACKO34_02700 [Vampirovibrionales bacterium]